MEGTGEMVQLVKGLLFKNEDLSSNPALTCVVFCASNPSKEEVETGRSLVLQESQFSLVMSARPVQDPVSKNKLQKG